MLNFISNLFKTNCDKIDKNDDRRYICLEKKKINLLEILNDKIKINSIHKNIYQYNEVLDQILENDLEHYLNPKIIKTTVSYKNIDLLVWCLNNEEELTNDINTEFEIFKQNLVKLQDIKSVLVNRSDNISMFNSNIISKYIINMRNIVNEIHSVS